MKDTTLKSLSEVVDITADIAYDGNFITNHIWDYNDFLKQSLKLNMFIPCKDGVPLEEPNKKMFTNTSYYGIENKYEDFDKKEYQRAVEEYQKALDRVLFKGFELIENTEYEIVLITNKIEYYYNIDYKTFNIRIGGYTDSIESIQDLTGKVQLTDKQYKQLNLR